MRDRMHPHTEGIGDRPGGGPRKGARAGVGDRGRGGSTRELRGATARFGFGEATRGFFTLTFADVALTVCSSKSGIRTIS